MATKTTTTATTWTAAHEAEAAEAVTRIADAEYRLAEAASARDEAVRQALAGGVPVATLAAAYRLTRSRVYQIRDGRR